MRITPILIMALPVKFLAAHYSPATPYKFPQIFTEPCRKYWWSHFLHLQNYVNVHQPVSWLRSSCATSIQFIFFQCNPPSWYLSVDFQLSLLTPFLIILILRRRLIAFVLMLTSIAIAQYLIHLEIIRMGSSFEGLFVWVEKFEKLLWLAECRF